MLLSQVARRRSVVWGFVPFLFVGATVRPVTVGVFA